MRPAAIGYSDAPWTFRLIGLLVLIHLISLNNQIFGLGVFVPQLVLVEGQWWRVLSAALLHADAMHLLFNSAALLIFGSTLERMLGWRYYLLVFFGGAVGANLLVLVVKFMPVLGAGVGASVGSSGGIMAIIGACGMIAWKLRRSRGDRQWHVLFQRMAIIVGLQVIMDLLIPVNSMLTHLAGLVCGVLLGAAILAAVRRSSNSYL